MNSGGVISPAPWQKFRQKLFPLSKYRTFQLLMFWLKSLAPRNIEFMFFTFAVFQFPMGWLEVASLRTLATGTWLR